MYHLYRFFILFFYSREYDLTSVTSTRFSSHPSETHQRLICHETDTTTFSESSSPKVSPMLNSAVYIWVAFNPKSSVQSGKRSHRVDAEISDNPRIMNVLMIGRIEWGMSHKIDWPRQLFLCEHESRNAAISQTYRYLKYKARMIKTQLIELYYRD